VTIRDKVTQLGFLPCGSFEVLLTSALCLSSRGQALNSAYITAHCVRSLGAVSCPERREMTFHFALPEHEGEHSFCTRGCGPRLAN
jgi:hypothetical protein